jgi:flagellin-like hook-associated protein FlgL
MRITQRAVALTSLQGLHRNLTQVGHLQEQLSSGRQLNRPSDSPAGTNRAMETRQEQAAVAQQARNISDAKAWLEGAGDTLQTMLEQTRRVRDLTVQGLNTGASTPASQHALATEVTSLRESLLQLANAQVQGRPMFGGTTGGDRAYTDGGDYVGDGAGAVTRRISDVEALRVDIRGPEVFGPPDPADPASTDLFGIVGAIATDLTADPTALAGHLDELDVVVEGMLAGLADVGARTARLEGAEQVNADRSLTLSSRLAEVENIDLPKTIMQLQMQQVGYEAALAATAKALQPTLLDFLR